MRCITDLDPKELSDFLLSIGQPSYRSRQIHHWIYQEGIDSFDLMLNLPKGLRNELKASFCLSLLHIEDVYTSKDGTQKFLFRLNDGAMIETVAIKDKGRITLCLSTQVGCRQGCSFCVTGKIGFKRSLRHYEISDQVLCVSRRLNPNRITHVVLMGMGEPLDNYSQTIKAVRTLVDTERIGLLPRRITLSTVGFVPEIERLGKEDLGIKLAISLNAPSDKIRDALMPANRRYPLSALIPCLLKYPLPPRQKITLEYCLIRGINDSSQCAEALTILLKPIKDRVKVNLIPYNENPVLPFRTVSNESLEKFQMCLVEKGFLAFIRKSKGWDILAACGQLGYRRQEENPL